MKTIQVLITIIIIFSSIKNASSQILMLSGTLIKQEPVSGRTIPAVGYRVFLFSNNTGWIGPSVSDYHGRYAFYNIPHGGYLMRIFIIGTPNAVWEGMVMVPGNIVPIPVP